MFKVGQVGVPPEADNVDIHDAEFGGEVVEVDCLRQRPHTQVHLRMRTAFEQQVSLQSHKTKLTDVSADKYTASKHQGS